MTYLSLNREFILLVKIFYNYEPEKILLSVILYAPRLRYIV